MPSCKGELPLSQSLVVLVSFCKKSLHTHNLESWHLKIEDSVAQLKCWCDRHGSDAGLASPRGVLGQAYSGGSSPSPQPYHHPRAHLTSSPWSGQQVPTAAAAASAGEARRRHQPHDSSAAGRTTRGSRPHTGAATARSVVRRLQLTTAEGAARPRAGPLQAKCGPQSARAEISIAPRSGRIAGRERVLAVQSSQSGSGGRTSHRLCTVCLLCPAHRLGSALTAACPKCPSRCLEWADRAAIPTPRHARPPIEAQLPSPGLASRSACAACSLLCAQAPQIAAAPCRGTVSSLCEHTHVSSASLWLCLSRSMKRQQHPQPHLIRQRPPPPPQPWPPRREGCRRQPRLIRHRPLPPPQARPPQRDLCRRQRCQISSPLAAPAQEVQKNLRRNPSFTAQQHRVRPPRLCRPWLQKCPSARAALPKCSAGRRPSCQCTQRQALHGRAH